MEMSESTGFSCIHDLSFFGEYVYLGYWIYIFVLSVFDRISVIRTVGILLYYCCERFKPLHPLHKQQQNQQE